MIQAAIHGRLGGDPAERTTKNNNRMATANLAVDAGRPGGEEETVWIGLVAFGKTADTLLRHAKGNVLSAMGSLTKSRFTGRDGQERESWSLTVESIISARTVRPSGGRKAGKSDPRESTRRETRERPALDLVGGGPKPRALPDAPFDDPIPF